MKNDFSTSCSNEHTVPLMSNNEHTVSLIEIPESSEVRAEDVGENPGEFALFLFRIIHNQ